MKITKYTHSCLLLEIGDAKILTDLGSWSTEVPAISGLSALLITHEHPDHCDIDKIRALLATNPTAQVITHTSVGALLENAGIPYTPITAGERIVVEGVAIQSCGTEHAIIYGATSPCQNTGYCIADRFYIPGDALHDMSPVQVEVLALPTGGPWMKVSDAIDYAKSLKPNVVIPIHDAMYRKEVREENVPRWIGVPLEQAGIQFVYMGDNSSKEF